MLGVKQAFTIFHHYKIKLNNMDENKDKKQNTSTFITDQLANERTFLAWVRTSIGIMAFGFVIEKFSLFLKQMGLVVTHSSIFTTEPNGIQTHSALLGIILLGFGTLICLLAFIKYKKAEQ